MQTFDPKDPSDVDFFLIGWEDTLSGDTISAISTVAITPVTTPALTESSGDRAFTGTTTTLKLSAGKAGENYIMSVKVTTTGGRTLERSAEIRVRDL